MNGRPEIAELVLEVPSRRPERIPDRPVRAERKSEEKLVPDKGPTGDLVPDCWGGIDLA